MQQVIRQQQLMQEVLIDEQEVLIDEQEVLIEHLVVVLVKQVRR